MPIVEWLKFIRNQQNFKFYNIHCSRLDGEVQVTFATAMDKARAPRKGLQDQV